jgi:integration host factor subunit beta
MNKSKLVFELSKKYPSFDKDFIDNIVTMFFRNIASNLKGLLRIEIRNFGVFKLKFVKDRKFYNPRSASYEEIVGRDIPFFKCSKQLHNTTQINE